ncbi:LysR family transcriptional regulator [Synoicihabitans lomoniglobus]|uniref:LysR family transcriptional regulator n=1 Tax=Synoicihabitans lomoniglobus TaxID=2909285 RepID=A0AAF0I4C6_9BACT|nr:LysR family transcriptional regulator [Opitutaceae bacterium LMO-M01]WED66763.1 LysR family transcriptional regulator [Opitutaceae bacterium LMO-M01]
MANLIDSRQLLAFATLARHGSFTSAAKELFLTQSAVSHAIKSLETELGVRVFDRIGKKAHLTLAGERLLVHADRILREMQDARSGIEELQNWGQSRLRIGASTTACQYLLPSVLREFKQSFPECVIRVEPADSPEMGEALRANEIDLALMLRPPNREDIEFRPLFNDTLELYVAPSHPWVKRKDLTTEERSATTFILYNKGTYTYRMVTEYLRAAGVTMHNPIEMGSMEAAKELVKIGLGVGVFARWVAQKELREGSLVALPIGDEPLSREWGFGHLRGRQLGLAEETFLGLFESAAETLNLDPPKAAA